MNDLTHLKHKLGISDPPPDVQEEQATTAKKRGRLMNAMAMMAGMGGLAATHSIFSQIDRANAKAEKDQLYHQVGEANYKPCRKKCKCFKACRCWEKTFDQQKACWEVTGGKITLELRDLWNGKMLPPDT